MSTRCICLFREFDQTFATIYRHCDGYPDGMGRDLASFLSRAEDADKRYPMSLLAANFVAEINAEGSDELELYPGIDCADAAEMIGYMADTDWEYAYMVKPTPDGKTSMSVNDRAELIFSGPPRLFLEKLDQKEI